MVHFRVKSDEVFINSSVRSEHILVVLFPFACVLLSALILGVVIPSLWTACALTAAVVLRHIHEAYLSESLTAKL